MIYIVMAVAALAVVLPVVWLLASLWTWYGAMSSMDEVVADLNERQEQALKAEANYWLFLDDGEDTHDD